MSRALLVIDVQNEYFTGALPITHPAGHLEQILRVMDAAQTRIPTVVIQHTFARPDKPFFEGNIGMAASSRSGQSAAGRALREEPAGEFHQHRPRDWLRERGISTVTIAGYMTHMCCDTTARQAVHRGFNVEFLSDATGTLPSPTRPAR